MASYKDILKEKTNQNWLKGSLALRITKAGLRGLVEGDSHRVQQKIHSAVLQTRHLAAGTTCSLCLTEHILQCPTKGLCSHPRNCKYHNSPQIHRPCPSQICDDFRDKICAVHRYHGPSWKNTKANQWCTNHWQVAKCFLPPDGYHDVTSYDETDFNGIISVMINCTEFQRRMSFPIGNQPNPLTEARVIGRKIRHSPDLKVTDTDLADYLATLNTLLTDSTFMASDMDAQQAVLKLQQLEKGTLPITTEEVRELLEEAKATVVAGIESGKRQLAETAETGKKDIEGVVSQAKLQFEDAMKTGKRNIEGVVKQGKLHLEDAMTTAKVVTERGKLEIEDAVAKSRDTVQDGKRELEEALLKIKAVSTLSEAEQRGDLRQRLVKYYQKQLNSAPISPLLSDNDERLDKFYVPPKIVKKEHRRLGDDQQQNGSPISSYKQIFCKEKGLANTVFVVGEAGMGKSSFSAMCTIKWAAQFSVSCRDAGGRGLDHDREEKTSLKRPLLNKKDSNQRIKRNWFILNSLVIKKYNVQREFQELLDSLSNDDKSFVPSHVEEFCELLSQPKYDLFQDEDTLRDIEFMFHIKLRDCCESCELSDMIRDQLINIIYRPDERAAGYSTMISVLSNRKCVVIADGLDEWTHPTETKCSCSLEDKVIPHLSETLDAAVVITSRPWRLSQNRVRGTKIGKYLEIKGVASTQLLVQKTLVCLNEKVAEEKICFDFIRFVARSRLACLLSVPIIALLLVCLWFDGVHESFSLCDIYAHMLDMMFGRKSLPVLSVSPEPTPLLQCFKQTEHVRNYYNIILKLAQLAFEKLYSRDRKSSLVFQNVDCLTQEELLFVLKSGIMRETKSQSLIRKSSSFSFIHKTVQEFLAAIHTAHHAEEIQRVIKPNYYETFQEYLASGYQLKERSMSDVSQIFIFMWGINREVAQDMSAMMPNDVSEKCGRLVYDNWNKTVQQTLCAGYREAKANNVQNIQLDLMCFYIDLGTRDLSTLKTLISMNKSQLRHITIWGHEEEFSEEELQALFISSKNTLTRVEIYHRAGQYDLSACCRLQYLTICTSYTSNITINTNSLVELMLVDVSEKVEKSIVQSLEHKCEQLNKFTIRRIMNISLFRKTLPQLNHLKQIRISNTILGDHPLHLPPSVTYVNLYCVTMSARCLRELVERVEKYSHTVNCRICGCTVEPIKEYEDIKRYTQSSKTLRFVDAELFVFGNRH